MLASSESRLHNSHLTLASSDSAVSSFKSLFFVGAPVCVDFPSSTFPATCMGPWGSSTAPRELCFARVFGDWSPVLAVLLLVPAMVSADANSGFASEVVSASTSVGSLSFPLASADIGADDGAPAGNAAAEGRVSATFTLVSAMRDKLRNSEETEGTSRVGMNECHLCRLYHGLYATAVLNIDLHIHATRREITVVLILLISTNFSDRTDEEELHLPTAKCSTK
jgi:hypothetical protein